MSLSDRLADARRRLEVADPTRDPTAGRPGAPKARRRSFDPFAEVKKTVHTALLETLGPQLYDATMTQTELESRVRWR